MCLLATAWDSHYNVDHRVSEQLNAGSLWRTIGAAIQGFPGSRDLLFWTCALSVARDHLLPVAWGVPRDVSVTVEWPLLSFCGEQVWDCCSRQRHKRTPKKTRRKYRHNLKEGVELSTHSTICTVNAIGLTTEGKYSCTKLFVTRYIYT